MISNYDEPKAERRPRTLTREMAPFWLALAYRTHDSLDKELMAAEWGGFPEDLREALGRAGLTCQRQVEALPDFLLRTIPNIGPVRLAQIRGLLPYNRAPLRAPNCPAKYIEADRWITANTRPIDNLHIVQPMIDVATWSNPATTPELNDGASPAGELATPNPPTRGAAATANRSGEPQVSHQGTLRALPKDTAWGSCECRRWALADLPMHPSGHHPYCPSLLPQPHDAG